MTDFVNAFLKTYGIICFNSFIYTKIHQNLEQFLLICFFYVLKNHKILEGLFKAHKKHDNLECF